MKYYTYIGRGVQDKSRKKRKQEIGSTLKKFHDIIM